MTNTKKQNLIYSLESINSVNSSLLLQYLDPERQIVIDPLKIDDVAPELLVDFQLNLRPPLLNFYEKLRDECLQIQVKKGVDFRYLYIKWKLGLFSKEEKERVFLDIHQELSIDSLLKKADINLLYKLRTIIHDLSSNEKKLLGKIITPMAVYFARRYRLQEFSLCVLLALDLREEINELFFGEALNFLYWNQRDNGLFNFGNPFVLNKDDSESLLTTAYCILAIDKLTETGYEKNTTKQLQ